jgi:hypothetical protein
MKMENKPLPPELLILHLFAAFRSKDWPMTLLTEPPLLPFFILLLLSAPLSYFLSRMRTW